MIISEERIEEIANNVSDKAVDRALEIWDIEDAINQALKEQADEIVRMIESSASLQENMGGKLEAATLRMLATKIKEKTA